MEERVKELSSDNQFKYTNLTNLGINNSVINRNDATSDHTPSNQKKRINDACLENRRVSEIVNLCESQ